MESFKSKVWKQLYYLLKYKPEDEGMLCAKDCFEGGSETSSHTISVLQDSGVLQKRNISCFLSQAPKIFPKINIPQERNH